MEDAQEDVRFAWEFMEDARIILEIKENILFL